MGKSSKKNARSTTPAEATGQMADYKDIQWGDPQYVKKNARGKVTGDIIIHHVKPKSEMAKIMNLKDVKGQPTVILLKVTDFFPFKAWKVLYATTENSKKTLSTPVWCPEAQAHLVGGKKKDVMEFHDMYVKEFSTYAPKVTTKFDVKYVKSLPNISSEILSKFKGMIWTVMAVVDEIESEESESDDDMSVKHETEEDEDSGEDEPSPPRSKRASKGTSKSPIKKEIEDSGEDEPSPPRSKRASKGTSKSPIKKATAQRSKKEKKGSGISWDTILKNTRRTRKCKSSKAKKESSDDGDTESEKSHSDSVLTDSEELSVHASDDDFVVPDEDEEDANSKASYKPSENDDSDEESASERNNKSRPSKRSSRRAAAAFKAGGEKKKTKKKATKKVATDSDDDSADDAALSLTGSNIEMADKMERLRNEMAVMKKAMDENMRKQTKTRKRRGKGGVPSSASDSDGDVSCPETPETIQARAISSAKHRAAIRDKHCASQASTTASLMMLKAREDPLPSHDEAEILQILKAPNPTSFWHSEPALSAWPATLPEGAANLVLAAKNLDLLQAKAQATGQRAVVQAVPLSVDGLARPWAVDPTTSAPAPATSNEPSA